jgi:hypothetical protein
MEKVQEMNYEPGNQMRIGPGPAKRHAHGKVVINNHPGLIGGQRVLLIGAPASWPTVATVILPRPVSKVTPARDCRLQ